MSDPKTPRDWLLARHASTDAQLDALRRATLAQLPAVATSDATAVSLTWREALGELVRPHRVVWRALAVVWIAMALLQFTRPDSRSPAALSPPSAEAFTAWLSQLKSHETFAQMDRRP